MKHTEADRSSHDRALSGHKMHHKHLKHINSNRGRRCSRKEADRTRLETLAWLLLVFPKVIQQQPSEKTFSKKDQMDEFCEHSKYPKLLGCMQCICVIHYACILYAKHTFCFA